MNFTMSIKSYYRRLLLIVEGKQATPEEDACSKDYLRHTSTGNLQPVLPEERNQLLDVLRGFALFGILLENLMITGAIGLTPERAADLATASIDPTVKALIRFFIFDKFLAIFSFMFGLSFAIQITRAAEQKASITPVYLRRLVWLLFFGIAHMLLLWWADILHYFALMGLILLAIRNWDDKTVLLCGLVLAVFSYAGYLSLPEIRTLLGSEAIHAMAVEPSDRAAAIKAQIATFTTGSYFNVLKQNWLIYYSRYPIGRVIAHSLYILGYVMLGYFFGRRRFFQQVPLYQGMFRKLVKWGLIIGLPGNAIFVLIYNLKLVNRTPLFLLAQPAIWISILAMSCFYIALITLLFQSSVWQRTLLLLAPVGRMSLTNYLMQSLFFTHLLYGFGIGLGLLGRIGPSLCIPITIGFFAFQIVFSKCWLKYFRFGPTEWLWRLLTYGKRQPMRV